MPSATKNPAPGAVAASSAAPYTGPVSGERAAASVPWWKDAVRSWAPVLGFAVLLVFQMVSLQQQIGELRTDLQREIGDLRTDVQKEIGDLRTDVQQGDRRSEGRPSHGHRRAGRTDRPFGSVDGAPRRRLPSGRVGGRTRHAAGRRCAVSRPRGPGGSEPGPHPTQTHGGARQRPCDGPPSGPREAANIRALLAAGPLAQLAERSPFKRDVAGSNPARPTLSGPHRLVA